MENKMKVMDLLAELDKLVDSATTSILSSETCKINKNELQALIGELRSSIPDEVTQAMLINKEKNRIIKEAKDEAEEIINKTKEEMKKEMDSCEARIRDLEEENQRYLEEFYANSEPIKEAHRRAEKITVSAEKAANEIREGAVDYARAILIKVEDDITSVLGEIQESKNQL